MEKPGFHLHEEDCLTGMARLETASVDVVITSPPYNLGIRYPGFRDDTDRATFLEWTLRWGRELRRVLKPCGALFLNVGASPANPLLPHQMALQFAERFVLQNTIHWIKSITVDLPGGGPPLSVGHYQPIRSPRYLNQCHEYLFHFTPLGETPLHRTAIGVPYADKANLRRWQHTGGRDRRCRGNAWFIPYRTIHRRESERPHPATFPVELAFRCLRLHGAGPESTVLDPFLGLGSSALAALRCRVGRFIGFEIDPDYVTEARRRVKGATTAGSLT